MPQRILEGSTDALRRFNRLTLHLLGLIARVRPEERRDVVAATLTLLGFMAGHALLETARDALFLASLPARRLPWVYLVIAVVALAIGQREPRVVRSLSGRSELSRWLAFAGVVTSAFFFIVGTGSTWVLYALYVWSGVLASLVVVRFWTLLTSRFTVTQAKRIFPIIGSGSLAGAILGSALARALTEVLAPRYLVLAAAVLFLLTAAAPSAFRGDDASEGRSRPPIDLGLATRAIWRGPYVRRLAVIVLLATVTFTLVDFVFKSTAARLVPAEDLGAFFSSVYLSFNLLSLVIQTLVVALLLRHAGLVRAVAVVPAALFLATLGFAVGGGLTLVLVLKGADGTLRHSLYRTGTELLFVPLSDRLRTQVKGVIDVLGQRGGQALASVVILMLLSTTANESVFAVLACLTAAAWLVAALGLREHYLNLFRETLYAENAPRGTGFPALDVASLETLLATLNTVDDRRVLAALDVLRAQGKESVVPALLLYHPSPSVVVRALDVFVGAGRTDVLPMTERLIEHTDAGVRAAAVRALAGLAPSQTVFRHATNDPDAGVACTGRAALLACGWGGPDDAAAVESVAAEGAAAEATLLASLIHVRPDPSLEPALLRLLSRDETEVLRPAIAAARSLRSPALLEPLMVLLARRTVREDARRALAAFGPVALHSLTAALGSPEVSHAVRRHIPGAIALLGTPQAPDVLLRHLESEADGMIRYKVLRALGRWRHEQPGFPLDVGRLQDALGQAVSTSFRLMAWRRTLMSAREARPSLGTELHEVLVALLRDKQDHALERIFRLLNLQSGSEEFRRVYRGLHSPNPQSRAGSRELLHHLVLPAVRRPLLSLVEDLHGEGGTGGRGIEPEEAMTEYAAVLQEIIAGGMESASAVAAMHAAELNATGLEGWLDDVTPISSEHAASLDRARVLALKAASA